MTSEDFERQFAMVEQSGDDPSSGMEFPEQEPAFQDTIRWCSSGGSGASWSSNSM